MEEIFTLGEGTNEHALDQKMLDLFLSGDFHDSSKSQWSKFSKLIFLVNAYSTPYIHLPPGISETVASALLFFLSDIKEISSRSGRVQGL